MNILLGLTGSVAATKADLLYTSLCKAGKGIGVTDVDVRVVATKAATHFINAPQIPIDDYYTDHREWFWRKVGDPVCHIDLKDWADVFVIAPLTANTLAKMANGLCDNLLTCIYRGFSVRKPLVLAPAMNTDMWNHPITREHIQILEQRHTAYYRKAIYPPEIMPPSFTHIKIVSPVKKKLACGTTGIGAMANISNIVDAVRLLYVQKQKEKEKYGPGGNS